MQTKFIEATNGPMNWGKFMVARFTADEWERRATVDGNPFLKGRGWDENHILVVDLQTGEGSIFRPGGLARADLDKHRIWVCPLFEPFLIWLYKQELDDLAALPASVDFTQEEAPFAFRGYRREGSDDVGKCAHPGCPSTAGIGGWLPLGWRVLCRQHVPA
jgi:hypothetical protein